MGTWLKSFSILALLGFPVGVIGTRLGIYNYQVGIKIVVVSFLFAALLVLVGLFCYFKQSRRKPASAKSALHAVVIALIPVIGIGSMVVKGRSVPPIHNISTDVADPPKFARIAEIRSDQDNPLEYNASELAAVQQEAYPNVKTLIADMSLEDAHRRALVIANGLGWDVINDDMVLGIIEATQTTALWGFKDDIVIRLRSGAQQSGKTVIDLRSVSRVGVSDMGANAKRIEAFLIAFNE